MTYEANMRQIILLIIICYVTNKCWSILKAFPFDIAPEEDCNLLYAN